MKSSFVKTITAVSGVLQTDGKNTSGILVEYERNTSGIRISGKWLFRYIFMSVKYEDMKS